MSALGTARLNTMTWIVDVGVNCVYRFDSSRK
jgi:hypothetical protein